jgi:hypothetical protein
MAPAPGRRHDRRRDRSAQVAVLAFAAFAAIVAAIAGSPRPGTAAPDDEPAVPPAEPAAVIEPGRTFLFGHVGSDHRVDLLVVFGWERDGSRGTAVLVPPALVAELPRFGARAVADVPRLTQAKHVELVLENELGMTFDDALFVDDEQLAALLAPASPLRIELAETLRARDPSGVVTLSRGRHDIDALTAKRLLVARRLGSRAKLDAVEAVLPGWLDGLANVAVAAQTVALEPGIAPVARTAGADLALRALPVEPVPGGSGGSLQLRADDARALLVRAFPWAVMSTPRPRVEMLNGVGAAGIPFVAANRVVPDGAHVTVTGDVPGFDVPRTRVLYYRPDGAEIARRLVRALGVGEVVAATTEANEAVDVTIVVGKDFRQSR